MDPRHNLHCDKVIPLSDPTPFRSLFGKLIYLTHSRPNISFSVCRLSQHLAAPTETHMQAAFRILCYIKNAPALGLYFKHKTDLVLTGFSDFDWGTCLITRRLTTGLCFFMDTSAISWKYKKQHTVSRPSSEAEYHALANTTCESVWLKFLLHDFNIPINKSITIYHDNRSALQITTNPIFLERTKHIEMDCHVIREKIQDNIIHLMPIDSANFSQLFLLLLLGFITTTIFTIAPLQPHPTSVITPPQPVAPTINFDFLQLCYVDFNCNNHLPLSFLFIYWFIISFKSHYITHLAN